MITFNTFVEMQSSTQISEDSTKFQCAERASAEYVLMPQGYVMSPGDAIFANSRVAELQIDGWANLLWFGAKTTGADASDAIEDAFARISQSGERAELFVPGGSFYYTRTIVLDSIRNIKVTGVGGNIIDRASAFEYIGPNTNEETIKVVSCFNVEFKEILFTNRTADMKHMLHVTANDSPALSGSNIVFDLCGFWIGGAGSIATGSAGIHVNNNKNVIFKTILSSTGPDTAIRFGGLVADYPDTLMQGTCAQCAVYDSFIFGDIEVNNTFECSIENTQMDAYEQGSRSGSIFSAGDQRAGNVKINYCQFAYPDTRPAIKQGNYAGTANIQSSGGWEVHGCNFRDRAVGIEAVYGSIDISHNVFQARQVGDVGVVINNGALAVNITNSNDFTAFTANGEIAIDDKRTNSPLFIDETLASDVDLTATNTFQDVISVTPVMNTRGGYYEINYNAVLFASTLSVSEYQFRVLVGSTDYGTLTRNDVLTANQDFSFVLSKKIKLSASTAPELVRLQVQQTTSGGGFGKVRGVNANTFLQITELSI